MTAPFMRRGLIEIVDEFRHFYQFTVAAQSSYPLSQSRSDPAKPQQPMEFLGLLVIGFLIAILVLPFVALAKASRAKRGVDDLVKRLSSLENELRNLRPQTVSACKQLRHLCCRPSQKSKPFQAPIPAMTPAPVVSKATPEAAANPARASQAERAANRQTNQTADRLGAIHGRQIVRVDRRARAFPGHRVFREIFVRAQPDPAGAADCDRVRRRRRSVVGGLLLKRKENAVTAQTLCATGILVLYAVTFACRAYYHFAFFGLVPTFLLMTLITAVAFCFRSVERHHRCGTRDRGWISHADLLSTKRGRSARHFFGYIALLDISLPVLAQRQRWNGLPILGTIGTALMQFAWVGAFFVPEKYFAGNKVLIFMAVFVGF